MAQKLQVCLVACLLCISTLKTYASSPDSYLLFSISSESKARLGIVNKSKKNIRLEILNLEEEVLFTQLVSGYENYFQLLDLSGMPDGEYIVRMTKGMDESTQKKFKVESGTAVIVKAAKEMPPVFRVVDDNSIIISYLNAESNSVSIFFEYLDEVVFEDRNINDMPVSKRYSLTKLPKGEYLIKLYSGGRIYDYNLTVN